MKKPSLYIEALQQRPELWDRFTLKEEYHPKFRDKYGRFPDYLSSNRDFFEPAVSRFLIDNNLIHPEWPDEKNFAVCLTHDIDIIYPYHGLGILPASASMLIRRNLTEAARILFSYMNKKISLRLNLEEIMQVERKYDATSSFYFLALEEDEIDFNYAVSEITDIVDIIINEGWEIGLHGSRQAFDDVERIKLEKRRLEKVLGTEVVGYRNHYLCFKTPDTWHHLKKAGFLYDTTLGYDGVIGFRNGMCHPFHPFDVEKNAEIDGICELPLVIMDCSLIGEFYMRLGPDQIWSLTKKMIDTVAELNGMLTILWHNTYFIKENLEFYEKILKYCYKRNAWITSGKNIWKWNNSN